MECMNPTLFRTRQTEQMTLADVMVAEDVAVTAFNAAHLKLGRPSGLQAHAI